MRRKAFVLVLVLTAAVAALTWWLRGRILRSSSASVSRL
jgi:hypothetical protein